MESTGPNWYVILVPCTAVRGPSVTAQLVKPNITWHVGGHHMTLLMRPTACEGEDGSSTREVKEDASGSSLPLSSTQGGSFLASPELAPWESLTAVCGPSVTAQLVKPNITWHVGGHHMILLMRPTA
jgi:hypothetical protein